MSATTRLWARHMSGITSVFKWGGKQVSKMFMARGGMVGAFIIIIGVSFVIPALLIYFITSGHRPVDAELIESNMSNECYRNGAIQYLDTHFTMPRDFHYELLELCDEERFKHQAILEKYRPK